MGTAAKEGVRWVGGIWKKGIEGLGQGRCAMEIILLFALFAVLAVVINLAGGAAIVGAQKVGVLPPEKPDAEVSAFEVACRERPDVAWRPGHPDLARREAEIQALRDRGEIDAYYIRKAQLMGYDVEEPMVRPLAPVLVVPALHTEGWELDEWEREP